MDPLRLTGFSSLLLSSLELSDTKVYAPQIRALLGTASHFDSQPKTILEMDYPYTPGWIYCDPQAPYFDTSILGDI